MAGAGGLQEGRAWLTATSPLIPGLFGGVGKLRGIPW
jgi:hypothetical protein